MVSPGGRFWQTRRGPYGELIGCWVNTPPQYTVQHRRVLAVVEEHEALHQDQPAPFGQRGDVPGLRQIGGHRLLHQHVLAGVECGHDPVVMQRRGQRDVDSVDVRLGEQFLVPADGAAAELGGELPRLLRIPAGQSGDGDGGVGLHGRQHPAAGDVGAAEDADP